MTTNLWVEQVRKYCINHQLQDEQLWFKFVEFDLTFRMINLNFVILVLV